MGVVVLKKGRYHLYISCGCTFAYRLVPKFISRLKIDNQCLIDFLEFFEKWLFRVPNLSITITVSSWYFFISRSKGLQDPEHVIKVYKFFWGTTKRRKKVLGLAPLVEKVLFESLLKQGLNFCKQSIFWNH